jgi:hypothetical protein
MTRRWLVPSALLLAIVPFVVGAAAADPKPVAFADARLIIEVNATDGDAGLQFLLDAEAWKQVAVFRPDGEQIVDFRTAGPVNDYGLTELFAESSEPPFTEFPLDDFKALFPEGVYTFTGTTIGGASLAGTATLTHDIPNGPQLLSPQAGERVARDQTVIRWSAGSQPSGVEIVGYQVIVTRENPLRVFSVDLSAAATSVKVPTEFLERNTRYSFEVLAIEAGGNQTLTSRTFVSR